MHELVFQIIFYCFAGVAVLSAILTVTQNNPVRSVLFLVLTFFASAGIWMMLSAEFLALILILVYVGAVMTLFLFVVMMLNIDLEAHKMPLLRYAPFGLIIVALITGLLMKVIPSDWSLQISEDPSSVLPHVTAIDFITPLEMRSNTLDLGRVIYTDYVLAFEIAAALLLVAIISAITLAHRRLKRSKRQSILNQIMTDPKERLHIVKMDSAK